MSNANPRTVGIVGLGYVGLPLSDAFEAAGHHVIGFDVDPSKPKKLDQADSYLPTWVRICLTDWRPQAGSNPRVMRTRWHHATRFWCVCRPQLMKTGSPT